MAETKTEDTTPIEEPQTASQAVPDKHPVQPPYIEFDGRRYPYTESFSNREMLMVTQLLESEGIDVAEGLPSWAVVIGKLFVSAKRIGEPLTMKQILDGDMCTLVGEEEGGDVVPPAGNGSRSSTRSTKERAGRRS